MSWGMQTYKEPNTGGMWGILNEFKVEDDERTRGQHDKRRRGWHNKRQCNNQPAQEDKRAAE